MSKCNTGDGSILRPELTPMPIGIAHLPIVRGYPVPWFVDWVDGGPEFRAMDYDKFMLAVTNKLCWVCGEPLGRFMVFVIGPMCGINRISAEPPCHADCAIWSARNCPFLSRPDFERRETEMRGRLKPLPTAGVMIARNPGVTMLWTTRDYKIIVINQSNAEPGYLFNIGEPTRVQWFREGRPATRDEVEDSTRTGLPLVMEPSCSQEEKDHIEAARVAFLKYLPA